MEDNSNPAEGAVQQPQLTEPEMARLALEQKLKSGASWFYWIAGLSMVNTVSAVMGSDWRFLLGLGITQLMDAIATQMESGVVPMVINMMAVLLFLWFGYAANQAKRGVYLLGMIVFALDGALQATWQDWIGVGFHVFALYFLYQGYSAAGELNRLNAEIAPGLSQVKTD
jgi:hypothetical protein